MPVDRNATCPCGSGRKYKRCCLRRDADATHALRLVGGDPEAAVELTAGMRYPAGPVWQADIIPIASTFENDAGARPVVALVGGNGFILHANVLSCGPSEPIDVAAAIATAIDAARPASADEPRTIEVRFQSVGDALGARLGATPRVIVKPRLAEIEEAAFNLHKDVSSGGHDARLYASSPEMWKGWMLGEDRVRRLFAAAAAFHRAKPWVSVPDEASIEATVPSGGTWYLAILGNAGQTFGLAAYASLEDLDALLFGGEPGGEGEVFANLTDAVLSVTFVPSSHVPRPMKQEIRSARFEVDGDFAFPMLMVLNTPAGGITGRQADDLIAILRDVSAFVARRSDDASGAGSASDSDGRTRFAWVSREGEPATLWPVPTELSPALCGGWGADHRAMLVLDNGEHALVRAEESVLERYSRWLGRPVAGKRPADSTITRHVRPARVFTEFMVYSHGARLRGISELDLRAFLYDHALRRDMFGDAALDQLRGSLRKFFAFLAECEGIECPWAREILDDADAFALRRSSIVDARVVDAEADWRADLTDDLVARVLVPESVTEEGLHWLSNLTPTTFALFRELMRRWLLWRDEAIASGCRSPADVRAIARRKQDEWHRTVHPELGVSPAAALATRRAAP